MDSQVKVNLRSLNLRDDIFHTRYNSSSTRLSNIEPFKGKTKSRDRYGQLAFRSRVTEQAWSNFADQTITGSSGKANRRSRQYKAIEMKQFNPDSVKEEQLFHWDQARLGNSIDNGSRYGRRNRRNIQMPVNNSVDLAPKSRRNSSKMGAYSPTEAQDKILDDLKVDYEEKHHLVGAHGSRTGSRVIYVKKGRNKISPINARETVVKRPSENEVNQGGVDGHDMLETAKFQTNSHEPNQGQPLAYVSSPRKQLEKKRFNLPACKAVNGESPPSRNGDYVPMDAYPSFTSHEKKEMHDLQLLIASGNTSGNQASGRWIDEKKNSAKHSDLSSYYGKEIQMMMQTTRSRQTPQEMNVFNQESIKINKELIRQSPGLEENLQIKKVKFSTNYNSINNTINASQDEGSKKDQGIGQTPKFNKQIDSQDSEQKVFLQVQNVDEVEGYHVSSNLNALKSNQFTKQTLYDNNSPEAVTSGAIHEVNQRSTTYGDLEEQPQGSLSATQKMHQLQHLWQQQQNLKQVDSLGSDNQLLVIDHTRQGFADQESHSYKTIVNENGGDSIQSMTGFTCVRDVEFKTIPIREVTTSMTEEESKKKNQIVTNTPAMPNNQSKFDPKTIVQNKRNKKPKRKISPDLQKVDLQIDKVVSQKKKKIVSED